MPLAPVIMVAVRVPDWAKSIMAAHACSSVNWCKSNVACFCGAGGAYGMRRDSCSSRRIMLRVSVSFGVNCSPIISIMSRSVNCFIVVPL